ncbi:MAG TPA: phosphate-starvation-inducible PsiE family protein [Alphaproteobacteria bacterium]|nr:phosphate-starvation-inducible PsiE family protein [Alphaproteobacteria bacterium]
MKAANFAAKYRKLWSELGPYAKFEHVVAIVLIVLISLVIAASTLSLALDIAKILAGGVASYSDIAFEEVFGRIMTVLIALEFNVSIAQVLASRRHIVQVRTVVLVAILAIARKFIIIDIDAKGAETLIALAVIIAALGATYWVLNIAERRSPAASDRDDGK